MNGLFVLRHICFQSKYWFLGCLQGSMMNDRSFEQYSFLLTSISFLPLAHPQTVLQSVRTCTSHSELSPYIFVGHAPKLMKEVGKRYDPSYSVSVESLTLEQAHEPLIFRSSTLTTFGHIFEIRIPLLDCWSNLLLESVPNRCPCSLENDFDCWIVVQQLVIL